jgi:ferredoxin
MEMDIYKKLADHLDNLPGGFTPSDRCIGCGLCVSTCPTGYLILKRKSVSKHVPLNLETTWKEISLARAGKQTG